MALPKEKKTQRSNESTVDLILDQAESTIQTRGYNSFSYADVAAALGITKTAVHHHFPRKADLGMALIDRFTHNVLEVMRNIEHESDNAMKRLSAYFDLYLGSLSENKMCLCGMLAAEHESLDPGMQDGINEFFDGHMAWLERVLERGRQDGQLQFRGTSRDQARVILTNMQGGLLIAKSQRSFEALELLSSNLLLMLGGPDVVTEKRDLEAS